MPGLLLEDDFPESVFYICFRLLLFITEADNKFGDIERWDMLRDLMNIPDMHGTYCQALSLEGWWLLYSESIPVEFSDLQGVVTFQEQPLFGSGDLPAIELNAALLDKPARIAFAFAGARQGDEIERFHIAGAENQRRQVIGDIAL